MISCQQDDNSIRVRQHSNGKRRMSTDADPSKSKGKIPQHTSNVETHKLRKDRNTEDEPVIDLSVSSIRVNCIVYSVLIVFVVYI